MKITVQSSKAIKPAYGGGGGNAPSVTEDAAAIPLTVFDKVNYDLYISGINLFRPPSPPNAVLAAGLARALVEYREWAGRLGVDAGGRRAILLNDAGARFVEATANVSLDAAMPMEPTPAVLSLHPSGDSADELLLVQVTRFPCGAVAVGHTMHHAVADGRAACNFLLAWGQATRGAAFHPVPAHDRAAPAFLPRQPPLVTFQHRGVEFKAKPRGDKKPGRRGGDGYGEEIAVRRVRFSWEFVAELRSRGSPAAAARPYSAFQCVAAHLWRCVTKARGLDASEVTTLSVAVDGRVRMRDPPVPEGYAGNAVLWARPAAAAGELDSWCPGRCGSPWSSCPGRWRAWTKDTSGRSSTSRAPAWWRRKGWCRRRTRRRRRTARTSRWTACCTRRSATSTSAAARHSSSCRATCRSRAPCSSCGRSPATGASTPTCRSSAATWIPSTSAATRWKWRMHAFS
ncbi:unnamed protein product [Urochloa humidicola]